MKTRATIATHLHGLTSKGWTVPGLTKDQIIGIIEVNTCETLSRADIIEHVKATMGIDVVALGWVDPDTLEVINTHKEHEMPKKRKVVREFMVPRAPGEKESKIVTREVILTGNERAYMTPVAPHEGHRIDGNRWVPTKQADAANDANNIDGVDDSHSPSQIDAYLAELSALCHTASMDQGERAKAQHRRHIVFRELETCVQLAEAGVQDGERQSERSIQSAGNNSLMQKLDEIRSNMRAIIDRPAHE